MIVLVLLVHVPNRSSFPTSTILSSLLLLFVFLFPLLCRSASQVPVVVVNGASFIPNNNNNVVRSCCTNTHRHGYYAGTIRISRPTITTSSHCRKRPRIIAHMIRNNNNNDNNNRLRNNSGINNKSILHRLRYTTILLFHSVKDNTNSDINDADDENSKNYDNNDDIEIVDDDNNDEHDDDDTNDNNQPYKNRSIVWSTKYRKLLPYHEVRKVVMQLGLQSQEEWEQYIEDGNSCPYIPNEPDIMYSNEWESWDEFLGVLRSYDETRQLVQTVFQFRSIEEYNYFIQSNPNRAVGLRIPAQPDLYYKNKGWISFEHFFGTR